MRRCIFSTGICCLTNKRRASERNHGASENCGKPQPWAVCLWLRFLTFAAYESETNRRYAVGSFCTGGQSRPMLQWASLGNMARRVVAAYANCGCCVFFYEMHKRKNEICKLKILNRFIFVKDHEKVKISIISTDKNGDAPETKMPKL